MVEQLVAFFRHKGIISLFHSGLAGFCAPAHLAENIANGDGTHLRAGHAGDIEGGHATAANLHFKLDVLVIQITRAEFFAEAVTRGFTRGGANQRIQNTLFGCDVRTRRDLFAFRFLDLRNADVQQIADDLLNVAPHVAHLGELGGFHLEEGRIGKLGQTPRDFCFAAARGSDHQNVLGQNLLAHGARQLLPAPAVAQRNRNGALGILLADDEAIQLRDDFAGGKGGHNAMLSITRLVLV